MNDFFLWWTVFLGLFVGFGNTLESKADVGTLWNL